ncbi:MAG: peptidoglycan-binding protein LysM [Hyphomicrobiaceae bacterium]|nr:peptidoglycan-binding protein LysM [Hyphomicrobiaceae bacterium]
MGVFDFLKSVGEKLGIGGDDAPAPEALQKELAEHGLGGDRVKIEVVGDTVKVSGAALSSEEREKIVLAVGNVEGVAKVEEALTVEDPQPEATFYTVQKGDTLWKIAAENYGNGSKYNAIFEANKPMLKHPDKIYPGQVLRIPPQD